MLGHQPNAFQCTREDILQDADTYRKARSVLVYMTNTGNMASKQHLSMLEEVERYGTMLSELTGPASRSANEASLVPDAVTTGMELNFDDWAKLIGISDQTSNDVDPFTFV